MALPQLFLLYKGHLPPGGFQTVSGDPSTPLKEELSTVLEPMK